MVVDDEPVHRGLVADILGPLGFTVLEAQDADSCQALVEQSRADLYLLDVSMSGVNGLDLAQSLRDLDINEPIIMLSADAQERHNTNNVYSAHDDYIVKPMSNEVLLEKIGKHLQIEWLYRNSHSASYEYEMENVTGTVNPSNESFPDHPLLHELLAHAEIGFSKGVNNTLDKIAVLDLLTVIQLKTIRSLAKNFAYQQMIELLSQENKYDN